MGEGAPNGRRFNWRAFASLLTAWGFTLAAIAGVAVAVTPTAARQELLISSLLLLAIGCALHVIYNFKQLVAHIKAGPPARFPLSPEFVAATLAAALTAAFAIWDL